MKKILVTFSVSFLLLSSPAVVSAQCAMCKAVTKSNLESGQSQVGKGINKGVLYLLAIPYILAGIGGVIWYKNKKRQEAAN